ncbi:Acidic ribosomal protein P0 [Giardia duodenalis ATCC 50581]|uniref:60S acidic ribosomal protein P0 n=1 Tax=Giardia intestinalis (strain ATCC 50581 / GS clone H7) TaxID=598745 RepID=C6LR89_GIAIB|nr:Acidic ribosomal protein P0 [Giardia intestinalis ATCC 50581]
MSTAPLTAKQARRQAYVAKLERCLTEYKKIVLVSVDNVRSFQIAQIRRLLRGKAELLAGKNTIIKRVINQLNDDKLKKLLPYIKLNVGFVFTNGDTSAILKAFKKTKRKAAAKAGIIAPTDVVIEPMLTQSGPDQHGFYAALGIDTKINKGKIEIVNPVNLIKKGDVVTPSHATLLQKLEIDPFFYSMSALNLYDDGEIYDAAILEIDDSVMEAKWNTGLEAFVSLALGTNFPCLPAIPHIFMDTAKAFVGAGVEADITEIPLVKRVKEILADPSKFAVAVPAAAAAAAPAAEPAKKEESDDDEIVGAGGMFGGDSSSSEEESSSD